MNPHQEARVDVALKSAARILLLLALVAAAVGFLEAIGVGPTARVLIGIPLGIAVFELVVHFLVPSLDKEHSRDGVERGPDQVQAQGRLRSNYALLAVSLYVVFLSALNIADVELSRPLGAVVLGLGAVLLLVFIWTYVVDVRASKRESP